MPSYLLHRVSILYSPIFKTKISPYGISFPASPPSTALQIFRVRSAHPMAASMATATATSTVSKAMFFPSKDAASLTPKIPSASSVKFRYKPVGTARRLQVVAMSSPPPAKGGNMSEMVEESIKKATEVCADGGKSGECAAAWDEVEEVSAAASDFRAKQKSTDPLEDFCKDNPESDECRTYDN